MFVFFLLFVMVTSGTGADDDNYDEDSEYYIVYANGVMFLKTFI